MFFPRVCVVLIIMVIVWRCHRKRALPQLLPDKDVREHVMPYAETAGKRDTFSIWVIEPSDEIDTLSFDERKLGIPSSAQPVVPGELFSVYSLLFQ